MITSPTPVFFRTQAELRKWFMKNHNKAEDLIIGFYKISSGKGGITPKEAIDEALCFGWIDGIRRGIDEVSYCNRYTPRRARSVWSDINIQRVAELKEAGLMQPAGIAAFEKLDTKRTKQYPNENKDIKLLPAYTKELKANAKAWTHWQSKSKSYRHHVTHWIMSAKQEATQIRRLHQLIEQSGQELNIPQFGANPKA